MGAWLTTTLTILVDAAPYLLGGFLAAGLIHVFLQRRSGLMARLSGRGPSAVVWASLLGIPLPLCSCSVIPAGVALRRQGAGKGSMASFLVSVPETDVISIVLTYALLGPLMAIFRPVSALVSAILTGLAVEGADRWAPGGGAGRDPDPAGQYSSEPGGGRSEAEHEHREAAAAPKAWWRPALRYGFGDMFDDLLPQLLLGFIVAGAIAVWLPALDAEFLQGGSLWSYLAMVLVGAPMYVCATATTPVALALIAAGVSPGAALVLLLAGPATNVASLVVLYRELGRLLLSVYLGALLATSVAAGLAFDGLLSLLGVGIEAAAGSGVGLVPTLPAAASAPAALLLLVLALISLRRTRVVEETVRGWARRIGMEPGDGQVRIGLAVLVVLLWLSSGLFVVGPGERAATMRFGRSVEPYVEPGLRFHWPAPIGGIERVPVGRVQRIVVGPSDPTHEGDGAWVLAGDENIVDVRAVVHYRIDDTPEAVSRWAFGIDEPHALLERVSEWALRTAVTQRGIDTLLTTDRGELERQVRDELLAPALEALEVPARPLEVNLAYVHAPATVHWSFRDLASSMEEKQERIHRAAADRQEILAEARGKVRARISEARGRATEWAERAQGEASAFAAQVPPYRSAPSLTRSRLYLETLERALPGAKKVVDLVPGDSGPHLWLSEEDRKPVRVPLERPIQGDSGQRAPGEEGE